MIRNVRSSALLLLLAFMLSACGTLGGDFGGNPTPPGPGSEDFQPAEAPEIPADIGTVPKKPQEQKPMTIKVPNSLPVLNDPSPAAVREYVDTMARIHVQATKTRQIHEVPPQVTAVTDAMTCPTFPGQTDVLRLVGDTAKDTKAGKAMVIAACFKGGKPSIFFAPAKLDKLRRQVKNVQELYEPIRVAMRDYLAYLTQQKAGNYDRLITACTAGRMVGGLRDKGYIGWQYANTLEVSPDNTSAYARVYREARETGNCPPKLFGITD